MQDLQEKQWEFKIFASPDHLFHSCILKYEPVIFKFQSQSLHFPYASVVPLTTE